MGQKTLAGVLALAVWAVASPAWAGDPGSFDNGQWFYTNFHLAADQKISTGAGVTIALLDGPLDPSVPELQGQKIVTQSQGYCAVPLRSTTFPATATGTAASHATSLAVMMVGNGKGTDNGRGAIGVAPGATVRSYVVGVDYGTADGHFQCAQNQYSSGDDDDTVVGKAIDQAVADGAKIINMSFGGPDFTVDTSAAIGRAERAGVIVVAAPDDHSSPGTFNAPSNLNGVVAVNAIDSNTQLYANNALDPNIAVAAAGVGVTIGGFDGATWRSDGWSDGTSPAAAWVSAALADVWSKYPKATANQIIQSLCRNTNKGNHPLGARTSDGAGFGVASVTNMLAADPSTYPNTNPLLRDDAFPRTSVITGDTSSATPSASKTTTSPAAASSSPSRTVTAAPKHSGSGTNWGLIAGVIVVVVAAVAGSVLFFRRRSHA